MALRRLIAIIASFFVAALASAQLDPFQTLHSSPTSSDSLGTSISVDRDTMIVGAQGYDPSGKTNAGAAVVFRWAGSSWVEEARLVASDGVAGDNFGRSVSIQGNTAVVGAYFAAANGRSSAGAAYVFQRTGTSWTQIARLIASDAAVSDTFGASVDIDADAIIVGAPSKAGTAGAGQGAAYIFARSAGVWSQRQKLLDPTGSANDRFGASVAIEFDTAVIGAQLDDVVVADRGTAQVFTIQGGLWARRATLNPSDGAAFDNFGSKVAISSGTIVVSSPQADLTTNGNQGAIYVYTGSGLTWTQQQKLTRVGATVGDFFSTDVAIEGDTIVASCQVYDGIVGLNQGAGFSFTRAAGVWSNSEIFQPMETQAGGTFGSCVAISDEFVVAGAFSYARPGFTGAGAAYAFRRIGGVPNRTLTIAAPTPQTDANFGNRMASDGTRLVVGAYNEDGAVGTNQGAVYVYKFQDESLVLEQKLTPSDAAAGASFGSAVAIDGTSIIVGASGDSQVASLAGAAYVFTFNGSVWTQQAKLIATDAASGDNFGSAVAISGDRAVIGSPNRNTTISAQIYSNVGSAYIFTRAAGAWSQTLRLFVTTPLPNDNAGAAVGIEGDVIIVGIPGYDTNGNINQNRGGIIMYRWNGTAWAFESAGSPAGLSDGEAFGSVISSRAGMFAVSSIPSHFVKCYEWTGAAFALRANLNVGASGFGSSVSVQSDAIIVGAPTHYSAGTAYRYPRSGSTVSAGSVYYPGALDPSDNLGEAVGSAGGAVFAGGAGISLPGGTNQGAVRRLQPHPRLDPLVFNSTANTRSASFTSILGGAGLNDALVSELGPLARTGSFSFGASEATLNVPVVPFLAASHTITMTDGSELSTSSSSMALWNTIDVPAGANSRITASSLLLDLPSSVTQRVGSTLTLTPALSSLNGAFTLLPNATLAAGGIDQGGTATVFGAVVAATSLNNLAAGTISGYGDIACPVSNAGAFDVDANMQVVGNFSNLASGQVTVFNGTLTILGTLTNSGSIVGDVSALRSPNSQRVDPTGRYAGTGFGPRATQSIYAKGGIAIDAGAKLAPAPAGVIKTAGNFDCAINNNLNFTMLGRTLQLTARGPQNLEAMSMDRGPLLTALDAALPGAFPVGTLRIGPAQANVIVVDNRDNDGLGQAVCEAVYVDTLIIDVGTTLSVPCGKVYYKTLINNGTILTPLNVVALRGPCPADFNQDGFLTFEDFDAFVGAFEAGDAPADFNGDGFLTFEDFDAFVSAFEAGC